MKTLLIIDDDPEIRSLLISSVETMGFTTFAAADGEEGLRILENVHVDLIILDWMLPGREGPEILPDIRKRTGGDLIPVIMLTAREKLQDKLNAFEGGADDYITKPFQFQELQARIKALLRIRELSVNLRWKNEELVRMQAELIEKERRLLLLEFAGTAAHKLGQPLSAILLNCHLLATLEKDDIRYKRALAAIENDSKKMAEMLEQLKAAQATKTQDYYEGMKILETED